MSTLKRNLSNRDDKSSPLNEIRPSWMRWISYLQLDSFERSTTQTGWPMLAYWKKQMGSGGCAWTSLTWTMPALKTDSCYEESTSLWIPLQGISSSFSWMPFQAITKSKCRKKTRGKLSSSPVKDFTTTKWCHLGWRMQMPLINGWLTRCSADRLGETWKYMLTTC